MTKRKRSNCRDIHGVLLLDKPDGMTSNEALQKVKRLFRACKAGHTGSLDPIATGLLPLCFGEATKISQFMLDADKRYWTRIRLGVETATYDTEGEVVATRSVEVSRRQLEKALEKFEGAIDQLPPMYSAVKQGGQALYKLARQGVEVEREPRRVTIHELKLLEFDGAAAEVEMACTKGTYVRTLAHDLGQVLGCGGHVEALRRLGVGVFDVADAVTLAALEAMSEMERDALLLPIDEALMDIPEVRLTALATPYLLQGQPVSARHGHSPGWVRLYDDGGRFLGMGEVLDDGRVAPKRLMLTARAPAQSAEKD
jgi:tRNA pseudouridine55 synthase